MDKLFIVFKNNILFMILSLMTMVVRTLLSLLFDLNLMMYSHVNVMMNLGLVSQIANSWMKNTCFQNVVLSSLSPSFTPMCIPLKGFYSVGGHLVCMIMSDGICKSMRNSKPTCVHKKAYINMIIGMCSPLYA